MNSEREIMNKLLEGAEILPDDEETIIRKEIHPVNTSDRPNISEDIAAEEDRALEDLQMSARSVMKSYQNANRWLDSIKESILIDLGLPYFSKVVHDLAHRMPVSFDSFGDILHTINMKVPYPETEEWLNPTISVNVSIDHVIGILDAIKFNLLAFKSVCERSKDTAAMSIKCDPLVLDIQDEYEYYIRVKDQLSYYGENLALWDKKAYEIYNAMKEEIIE